jgi:hypothetical protein
MEIIDNNLCLLKAPQPLYREKPNITRPCANYKDLTFHIFMLNHFITIESIDLAKKYPGVLEG